MTNDWKRYAPKTKSEYLSMGFIFVIIPVFYGIECFLMIPSFYTYGSVWYMIHFFIVTFLMVNITSNLVAVIFTDTSIRRMTLKSGKRSDYKFCDKCDTMVPPRSWHCPTCNICILRRDHHCVFSGCCIGHFNHRFFAMFLLHLFIGCCYSFYFNMFYAYINLNITLFTLLGGLFPFMFLLLQFQQTFEQIMVLILLINLVGIGISGILLFHHISLVATGSIGYEWKHSMSKYNVGLKENMKGVLGQRWFLTWLSPFLSSPLLQDGTSWKTNDRKIP